MLTSEVENYPGVPDGVMGPELMAKFREQAERFGAEIVDEDATSVDFSRRPYTVSTDRESWQTHAVIIATGASAIWLGLPSEERLRGRGVSTCATCDGFFFRGKEIAVVGGGDTALEEATFLTRFASKVTLIHRRDQLRASKIMQERARKNPKIAFIWDSAVQEIHGDQKGGVTGVTLKNLKTGATVEFPTAAVFVAIGHHPNTDLFRGQLEMDELGYLKVRAGSTYTNVDGVFAAGDVADRVYRQAVTAAGTGCMAALDAERWLEARQL
jgi:thioredoxin reductase (NADPH)